MGGAFALALILVFFWMPESAYTREALNIDTTDRNVSIRTLYNLQCLTLARSYLKREAWSKLNMYRMLNHQLPRKQTHGQKSLCPTVAMSIMSHSGIRSSAHSISWPPRLCSGRFFCLPPASHGWSLSLSRSLKSSLLHHIVSLLLVSVQLTYHHSLLPSSALSLRDL